jgi:hypothetical protein
MFSSREEMIEYFKNKNENENINKKAFNTNNYKYNKSKEANNKQRFSNNKVNVNFQSSNHNYSSRICGQNSSYNYNSKVYDESLNYNSKNNNLFQDSQVVKSIREPRWDYLYKFDKITKSKIQERRESQKKINSKEEIKECTFSPKILKDYKSSSNKISKGKEQNVIERTLNWNLRKNNKINEQIAFKAKKDVEECVFKPVSRVKLYNNLKIENIE